LSNYGASCGSRVNIIETDIQRLREVEGIGDHRIEMIQKAWEGQKEIREVMIFLQGYGVSPTYAAKIYKTYGKDSVKVVKENPYRLAQDIFGIGFITADKIAEKIGIPKDSRIRAEAGILYLLHQLSEDGHVYYPYEPLIEECRKILSESTPAEKVERDVIVDAFGNIALDKKIIVEDLNQVGIASYREDIRENNKAVYLAKFYISEVSIADNLRTLLNFPKKLRPFDKDKAIEWVQGELKITLAERQI
jgi:exodeoxyribonuclease V alpha subunit